MKITVIQKEGKPIVEKFEKLELRISPGATMLLCEGEKKMAFVISGGRNGITSIKIKEDEGVRRCDSLPEGQV